MDVSLLVCSHYVLSYYDPYNSTCDCCVFWSIAHHYNAYINSNLCGPDNTGSTGCDFAVTVDSEGHNDGFCWPQQLQSQSQRSSQTYTINAMGHPHVSFSFTVELQLISYVICWVSVMVFASRLPCSCHVHQSGLKQVV